LGATLYSMVERFPGQNQVESERGGIRYATKNLVYFFDARCVQTFKKTVALPFSNPDSTMKMFIVFVIGVVVGVLAHRQFTQPKRETVAADSRETLRREVTNITQAFADTFDPATIKEELAKTGRVVREKARKAGEAIADATADARTTAVIKTKLLKASSLSALKIDVDTTDGLVTLSGTVSAHEEIAQAVKLALETEGVHKVVSTLQVKSN
jgi:hypothetical protein